MIDLLVEEGGPVPRPSLANPPLRMNPLGSRDPPAITFKKQAAISVSAVGRSDETAGGGVA
jgi:hypothetical protein